MARAKYRNGGRPLGTARKGFCRAYSLGSDERSDNLAVKII